MVVTHRYNTSEILKDGREGEPSCENIAQCYRLVLEAGADFEMENETCALFDHLSGFGQVVTGESSVSSKYHAATFLVLD